VEPSIPRSPTPLADLARPMLPCPAMQTLTLDRRDAETQVPVPNGRRITDPRVPRSVFPTVTH
jgi:hypothetical protein